MSEDERIVKWPTPAQTLVFLHNRWEILNWVAYVNQLFIELVFEQLKIFYILLLIEFHKFVWLGKKFWPVIALDEYISFVNGPKMSQLYLISWLLAFSNTDTQTGFNIGPSWEISPILKIGHALTVCNNCLKICENKL
jgi:hypothetical protein